MTPKEIVQSHVIRQVYFSRDEISEYFQPKQDYKTGCKTESPTFCVEKDDMLHEGFFWWEAFSADELLEDPSLVDDRKYKSRYRFDTENKAWKDCAQFHDIKPWLNEIQEIWLVSDWLYDRLKRRNESVIQWRGLPLWGRTLLDPNLYNDPTIKEVSINY